MGAVISFADTDNVDDHWMHSNGTLETLCLIAFGQCSDPREMPGLAARVIETFADAFHYEWPDRFPYDSPRLPVVINMYEYPRREQEVALEAFSKAVIVLGENLQPLGRPFEEWARLALIDRGNELVEKLRRSLEASAARSAS